MNVGDRVVYGHDPQHSVMRPDYAGCEADIIRIELARNSYDIRYCIRFDDGETHRTFSTYIKVVDRKGPW